MVSTLWTACSQGQLDTVQELLKEASNADIEIKDEHGATPLIEAVRNGHVEVVKALLDRGADSRNPSAQGPPETYTTDPTLLALLGAGQVPAPAPAHPMENGNGFPPQEMTADMGAPMYGPPGGYMYYPPAPPMPDGTVYYAPPPPFAGAEFSGAPGHFPPPDVARQIPCRFFPACRYGPSCMFAHPPPNQYYPGPMTSPNQYGGYDPAGQPFPPNYYPFPPSNGMPPPPNGNHARSSSEVVQPPFSPNGGPQLAPGPYGSPMVSPNGYPVPPVNGAPPNGMYPVPMPPAPYGMQPNYPPNQPLGPASYPEVNAQMPPPPLNPQSEGFVPSMNPAHARRGSMRSRAPFTARKPPCAFFPSGKCKNGDDCRFPHIMPDPNFPQNGTFGARAPMGRPRGGFNNGFGPIDEKMNHVANQNHQPNGFGRGQAYDGRGRFNNGFNRGGVPPHVQQQKRALKQRVPDADEFPVLGGPNGSAAASPPSAPAAQMPQANAPIQKIGSTDLVEHAKSESVSSDGQETKSAEESVPVTVVPAVQRLPISFAAATAAASLDSVKEVSVSA